MEYSESSISLTGCFSRIMSVDFVFYSFKEKRHSYLMRFITDRLALLAHSVCMKPNFQELLWDEFDGLGEDKL
jgi:hypothetical protein